ncbi:testis-specific protein TSX-like [Dipodomys merriami]|uniref:testis-specific protein TSX-like n=1 Tax=Dipodomys merriami TaxID=94247 RepID=UPI0038559A50
MSEEQEPEFPKENGHVSVPLKPKGNEEHLNNGDFTRKLKDSSSLGQENSLHLREVLQKEASSDDDDINGHQSVSTEDEDENSFSDSDPEDNVRVIIGKITINPAILKQMLLNSQTSENTGASTSVSTTNTTTEEE